MATESSIFLPTMKIKPETEFWMQTKVDQNMMDYVWSQINLAKYNAKDKLVGHISRSLDLPDQENKLSNLVLDVASDLSYIYEPTFQVRDLWVNFQRKHEFNPFHDHSGALSFVLWVKIPYKYEDECNTANTQNLGGTPRSGSFSFYYTSILGAVSHYDYLLDPFWEGTLLVFPSKLPHQVYPFYTSDEERISISGNIY